MCKKSRIAIMLVVILMMQSLSPICNIIWAKDQWEIPEEEKGNTTEELDVVLENMQFGISSDSDIAEDEQIQVNDGNMEESSVEDTENYSEAYLEWMELSEEEKQYTVQPRKEYIDISELQNNKKYATQEVSIPEQYNLREVLSNIKTEHQGSTGNCYAYAGLNSIETNIAIKTGTMYDFSEMHIEYMTSTLLGGNRTLNSGGNFQTVIDYSEELEGPVLESEVTNKSYSEEEYSLLKNAKPVVTVTETIEFPTIDKRYGYTDETLKEFRDSVKSHIMENGSVYASIYFSESSKYYNSSTKAYSCLDTSILTNHAISIIGWDDEYSADNFPETNRPINDGAWIALNSWGSSFGEDGVFYISYEDNWVEYNMSGIVSTENFVDTYGPKVELTNYINENNSISTTINVYDIGGSGINESNLKYQWTQSSEKPTLENFSETLSNGATLTKTYADGEQWYLWILAYDIEGNYTISGAVKELIFTDSGFYNALSKYALVDSIVATKENDNGTYSIFMTQDQIENVTSLNLNRMKYPSEYRADEYIACNIEGIENFINLKTLDLYDNGVTSLKGVNLPNGIETISLYENTLKTIEDVIFPDSLKCISLGSNDMLTTIYNINWPSSLESLVINNLDNLESLYLDLPINMRELYLGGNSKLKDISIRFAGDSMETIDLHQCSNITWENIELPEGLKSLWVSSCNLEDKLEKIDFPTSLTTLYLGNNGITDISCLSNLINLKDLCVGANNITDISVISNFSQLESFQAGDRYWDNSVLGGNGTNYNQINSIDNVSFASTLKSIDLSYNQITDISKIEWPDDLEYLYLDNNQINNIYLEPNNIKGLYLNNNNITDITGIKLGNDSTVRVLNLANNNIEELPSEQWINSNIGTIVLSNNNISNINDVVWPDNLDSLALDHNNLTELDNVAWKEDLRYLILSYNNITEIKNNIWPESLQGLEIVGNNLQDLEWIENGANLIAVALNENKIYDIESLSKLTKLQELHLDNNYVENISSLDELTGLTNLHIKQQSIIRIIEDQTENIELPQIIKQTMTENSKVYTEDEIILRNCELQEENIKYSINNLGYIFATVSGGAADGTSIFITDSTNKEFLKKVYTIYNKEDLINVKHINNYVHFDLSDSKIELGNDIDLGGYYNKETENWEGETWIPIGTNEFPFFGVLEGNGYTITGLYINSDQNYQGIIGYNKGSIQNITVEGYIKSTGKYVGGICAINLKGNSGIATIKNCKSNVEIYATGNFVGGICGENLGGLIENCYNAGNITAQDKVGGIAGNVDSWDLSPESVISRCYNVGDVSGKSGVGGICGTLDNDYNYGVNSNVDLVYIVTDCYNVGNINGIYWIRRNSRSSETRDGLYKELLQYWRS